MATFVSIIFGVWVYKEERQTRREEAINWAWSILTTPATGNSGKRAALEYLAGQGVSLRGIDLSCARMGGGWDAKAMSCRAPVDLTGLRLRGPNGEGVDLRLSRLDGVDLTGADLEDAQMGGARLAGATRSGARLDGADLRAAALSLGKLRGADLAGAAAAPRS
ncbi:pentapeptide repeat-containing protein [Phaeovulum vinaykumarii]|uniref:Pentapeptide repeat-containing protein n=1 Tax=Phaeovulum vinaykumarii TaxID=407234 RepID=A0A1N7LMH9_9RHOB|nr:pentapeptide repeat-containing protein [Phaeovulum vinaykumarii]SIS75048.1 Pentapeptide repeat-containing protein [Phaeovulum vinaykumarii]SOC05467.1 pentapeptide repeat protein [Phaeovulum vinaykumarii]